MIATDTDRNNGEIADKSPGSFYVPAKKTDVSVESASDCQLNLLNFHSNY